MPWSAAPPAVSHYDLQLMNQWVWKTAVYFYHVDVYLWVCYTNPLYTCWWPLASPSSVVSFKMVATPLSIVTWAIPAPISPAPRTASFLEKVKSTISCYIQVLMTSYHSDLLHFSLRLPKVVLFAGHLTIKKANQSSGHWCHRQLAKVLENRREVIQVDKRSDMPFYLIK